MTFKKQISNYVSEIDRFLAEFDAAEPVKSASQQEEIAKHALIARLRDHADAQTADDPFDF